MCLLPVLMIKQDWLISVRSKQKTLTNFMRQVIVIYYAESETNLGPAVAQTISDGNGEFQLQLLTPNKLHKYQATFELASELWCASGETFFCALQIETKFPDDFRSNDKVALSPRHRDGSMERFDLASALDHRAP